MGKERLAGTIPLLDFDYKIIVLPERFCFVFISGESHSSLLHDYALQS